MSLNEERIIKIQSVLQSQFDEAMAILSIGRDGKSREETSEIAVALMFAYIDLVGKAFMVSMIGREVGRKEFEELSKIIKVKLDMSLHKAYVIKKESVGV